MSLQQAIIEGFVDGILILTIQGEWVHANAQAREFSINSSRAHLNLIQWFRQSGTFARLLSRATGCFSRKT
jgi:hypothetical protein